jgi:hypothetical protein
VEEFGVENTDEAVVAITNKPREVVIRIVGNIEFIGSFSTG